MNHLYQCPQSESGRDAATLKTPPPQSTLRANQAECVRGLEEEIEDFLQGEDGKDLEVETRDWHSFMGKRQLDYSGRMVAKATALTWKQVEPALPGVGQAAQVDALELAEGEMKEIIRDPWKSVKPRHEWPEEFAIARSLVATIEDLHAIAQGLFQRSMSRILDPNEIFYDKNGRPLAGAFFGVGKDKYLDDDPIWEIL